MIGNCSVFCAAFSFAVCFSFGFVVGLVDSILARTPSSLVLTSFSSKESPFRGGVNFLTTKVLGSYSSSAFCGA